MNNSIELKVAKECYKYMGILTLWYIGISILVYAGLFTLLHITDDAINWKDTLAASNQSYIFMLIMGIILPYTQMEQYITLGITRKQLKKGFLIAALLLSLTLTAVYSPIYFALAFSNHIIDIGINSIPFLILKDFTLCMLFFLLGWLIIINFSQGKFFAPALAIITGVLCINAAFVLITDSNFNDVIKVPWSPLTGIFFAAILATAITAIIWKIMKKTPIKC